MIPRNATVLVVSRGDEELLRIGPRRALHFPQDEFGRYAGYPPAGQRRCDRGPREHARTRRASTCCCPARRSGGSTTTRGSATTSSATMPRSCPPTTAWSSSSPPPEFKPPQRMPIPRGCPPRRRARQLAGPLDELLRALLPADASIAVVTRDASQLPRVGDCRAVSPPDGANDLRAMLEEADAGDAEFLVIPAGSYDRVHDSGEPAADVGGWRLVTHQRHLGEVYERSGSAEAPADRAATPRSTNCDRRPTRAFGSASSASSSDEDPLRLAQPPRDPSRGRRGIRARRVRGRP